MNWITKEVIPQAKATSVIKGFEAIENIHNYLKKKLGEDYVEVELAGFTIIEDTQCPRQCEISRAYLRTQYESSDSSRRALEVQCLCCNECYLLLQELDS